MRKETLLKKKREILEKDFPWYFTNGNTFVEEDLKVFSLGQLKLLAEIVNKSEDFREKCSPFYTLSATEVLQKSSGKIAAFKSNGSIIEETEDEILSGAACNIYREWKGKN